MELEAFELPFTFLNVTYIVHFGTSNSLSKLGKKFLMCEYAFVRIFRLDILVYDILCRFK